MLTDKEVIHIANLARIELSDTEKEGFKKELSAVLDFVEKLKEVSVKNIRPLYQTAGLTNALRTDKHRGDFTMDENLSKLLIGQAQHRQEHFVKVRSVKKKQ